MFKFIQTIKQADHKGRWVYYQYILYLLLMIGTTVYAYLRIEVVKRQERKEKQELLEIEKRDEPQPLPPATSPRLPHA